MTGVMIENVNELAGYSAPHRACEGCFQAIARGPLRLVILTDGESENVNELAGYATLHRGCEGGFSCTLTRAAAVAIVGPAIERAASNAVATPSNPCNNAVNAR